MTLSISRQTKREKKLTPPYTERKQTNKLAKGDVSPKGLFPFFVPNGIRALTCKTQFKILLHITSDQSCQSAMNEVPQMFMKVILYNIEIFMAVTTQIKSPIRLDNYETRNKAV